MLRHFYLAAALCLLAMPSPVLAQDEQKQPPLTELKSMPTKDGFSAQLCLTTNENIFQEWVPDLRLPPVGKVARNKPVLTLVLIANPGVDDEGLAHVTYDIVVKKPDGTIYAEAPKMPGWNGRKAPTPGLVALARGTVTIKIEGDDPAGKYSVEAVVHDNVKGIWIKVVRSFLIE